ncbi:PBP1A family penicillin-binding protein [bacterium]|nr:MAG: PBP1A family penicillin-binding protein [bacterium]
MQDYNRGWKSYSSGSPVKPVYHHKPHKRNIFLRILLGFFSGIWKMVRWFFRQKGLVKKSVLLIAALALLGFIAAGSLFAYYSFNLPDPNKLATRVVPESTKIYDRNGKLLYEIYGEAKRTLIPLDQVPKITQEATIAVEDKNFYKHGGIDFIGIVRSVLVDVVTHSRAQGASTITQQFVRNAVLTREKTFTRKIKEIIISLQLERKYSKDEILQLYFNEIPYGSNAYGIQAASQTFFGKDARDLDLAESAYLAAMPQAPTFYNPWGPNREELDARARTVLQLMFDQGYITKAQLGLAKGEKVDFKQITTGILAPHFVLYIQNLLAQKYGENSLQEGGFKVTTTLDLDLQTKAEAAVAKQVPVNEKNYNAGNASLVALDPRNGQILAMVGSRDYFDKVHDGAVNVALRPRQPGSSFKPYVYATAFKQGMNPATLLMDITTNFGEFGGKEYIPQDYDGNNRGPVSIRQALQGSLNIPAVKTTILVGLNNAIDTAENMGITTLKDRSRYGPSLVLGGGEVTLLEHTAAYGAFADAGIKHDTVAILKIEDKNGNVLEQYRDSQGKEVLDPQVAYQIDNVLSDNASRVYIFGANNRLTVPGHTVGTKTGTTQEYHDAWTVGFTPSLVTGVWVGNNNNNAMKTKADGSVVAAPIWQDFMKAALEGKPDEQFPVPEGITTMTVDALSGKLPTAYTPSTKTDVFASFNAPTQTDDVHVPVTANGSTQVMTILHSEKPQDPAWENPVRAWVIAHGYADPLLQPDVSTADPTVSIQTTVPDTVTSLPWQISASATASSAIKSMKILMDGNIIASQDSQSVSYLSSAPRADGDHTIVIEAATGSGKLGRVTKYIKFALGRPAQILNPTDDQVVTFPMNIVVESAQDAAISAVTFKAKSSTGQIKQISGNITKQQIAPKMFTYTLNWPVTSQLPSDSYSLTAQLGSISTFPVVIKVP